MPWIDVALAGCLVIGAVVGIGGRGRHRRLLAGIGGAALALLIVAVVWEGLRWQVVVLAGLGGVIALATVWSARRARSRFLGSFSAVVAIGAVAVVAAAAWGLPPAFVPAPSGAFSVGVSSTVFTDPTRNARGGAADGSSRSLPVTIWYPADARGAGGPLVADDTDAVVEGLAAQYGVPSWVFAELRSAHGYATPGANAAAGSYPVVLFSPGLESSRWLAASWATEVASHGVVVVALDHPYDAAATFLADGTVARSELVATGDDDQDNRSAAGWTDVRAHDLSATIDALTAVQPDTPVLAGADLSHLTVAGHSLGGAAAILAASTDQRVEGVVDIDGLPRSAVSPRAVPTVILVSGDADPNPIYQRTTDEFVAAGATRLTIPGVAHLGFTDASVIIAPIPGITGIRSTAGPRAAAAATLAVVDASRESTPVDISRLAPLGDLG